VKEYWAQWLKHLKIINNMRMPEKFCPYIPRGRRAWAFQE
jgi:hypothetical protein